MQQTSEHTFLHLMALANQRFLLVFLPLLFLHLPLQKLLVALVDIPALFLLIPLEPADNILAGLGELLGQLAILLVVRHELLMHVVQMHVLIVFPEILLVISLPYFILLQKCGKVSGFLVSLNGLGSADVVAFHLG